MKRSLVVLASLVSTLALAACSGDQGPKGDTGPAGAGAPSISGITPGRAFLARKLDVTLSGSGTTWAEGTTVDFGAGVTVDKLTVASPTAIVASITVADSAAAGPRDVTVTAGDVASTYKGAFTVESPLALTVKGTAAQGSVFFVSASNKDLTTPFDTTSESGGLFAPPTFVGVNLKEIPGMVISVSEVSLYKTELAVVVDVTTAAGKKPISLLSGVEGTPQTAFPYPEGLELAARTASPLTLGTASAQSAKAPFESKLFSFTPVAGTGITDLVVTSSDPDFAPTAILLPKSGKFEDRLTSFAAASTLLSENADPIYVIALDTAGKVGDFKITASSVTAPTVDEAGSNENVGEAQALANLPTIVKNASLTSGTDVDWYSIPVAGNNVGKKLRVITAGGDANTDTVIELFKADGTTAIGEATDDNYHETFVSPALTEAANVLVKISYSKQSKWSNQAARYKMAVRFE